jgi:hypothetical protein
MSRTPVPQPPGTQQNLWPLCQSNAVDLQTRSQLLGRPSAPSSNRANPGHPRSRSRAVATSHRRQIVFVKNGLARRWAQPATDLPDAEHDLFVS